MTDVDQPDGAAESGDRPPDFDHTPVMLDTIVALFAPVPSGVVIDATLGGGGHSEALLDAYPHLDLIGLDHDADAVAAASRRLARFGSRVRIEHVRFDQMGDIVAQFSPGGVSGVLFDLGVSSPQLDRAERGFSFRSGGPLDMRMDRRRQRSADDVVNRYTAERLAETLDRYGDERFARRIAAAIVASRPVADTAQLAEIVASAIPAPARRKSTGHPARRSFQAIRIEVNSEIEILASSIDLAIDVLTPGGRCVAMSYHSGEDRLVKERFRQAQTGGCVCPPRLPCGCGATPTVELVTRGAIKATASEIERNPRAESVRIRAAQKLEPAVGSADAQAS